MATAILGKKIGMTQIFDQEGVRIPVTVVQAGPCTVLQVKSADGPDGYHALQLGFDDVKPHRSTIPQIGHARKAKTSPKAYIREVRLSEPADAEVGQTLTVEMFKEADVKYVDVIGTTIGKGFQGVMRRHGFGGQPASHGTERKHRSPGSIGAHAQNRGTSGAVKKGKRMAGHTGHRRCTILSQRLVEVDAERNMMLIAGAIPGPANGYVIIRKAKIRK